MLVCIASNPKDSDRASDLLAWMGELGTYPKHRMLIVGALTLDESTILGLANQARACGFSQVVSIRAKEEPEPPWPCAANYMFRIASDWVKDFGKCPFIWVESDSIPMREGWLDAIEAEYSAARKPFMGCIYEHPWKHMNGIAAYPENIRKFNPLIFNTEFSNLPFDTVRADLTLQPRNAHITKLIHRSLEDPATNTAHTFRTMDDLAIIPPECAIFHGCKDGTLIARLREQRNGFVEGIQAPPEITPSFKERLLNGVKKLISKDAPFLHAGNIGDTIYALAAIKAMGGGQLIISPQQRQTALCSVPINNAQFEAFRPLLEAQPYLKKVSFSLKYPVGAVRDLNHFRNIWVNATMKKQKGLDTLCKTHFYELGILDRFNDADTWLTVDNPIVTGKIVVARSPRYNSNTFPWKQIVDELHKDLLFVGLKSEHEKFERDFGRQVSFWQVKDLLEMARLIAGANCFIGNQSSPMAIAIGLGQTVFVEECERSADCRWNRTNYTGHLIHGEQRVREGVKLLTT